VGRSRGGRNTKIHALADAKGRLIAILLTAGEAHDCPVAERLIRRVKPPKRMLGDKAYDSAELREELHERGTKPVIPNRCNRKQPFSFSKRLYKLRWRIESAFNRLKDLGVSPHDTTGWPGTISPQSALPPPWYGGFNESGP
jgi:transposase